MPNKPPSPPMPWMARLQIAVLMAVTDAARRKDGTVNRCHLSIVEPKTSANPKWVAGVCTSDVTIDLTRNLWIRIFAPSDPVKVEKLPFVIYFHGGGFTFFSRATRPCDVFGHRICREIRAVVLSVNYRLALEHKYPAPYDDGIDVLRYLDSCGISSVGILSGLDLDLDFGSCFLAGDSAGGNIIHHVTRRWAAAVDSWEKVRIKGIVVLQPYFGSEERTEAELRLEQGRKLKSSSSPGLEGVPLISMARADWGWKAFLPEGTDRNHKVVHGFGDAVGMLEEAFPPAMVVIGGYDLLQDLQKRYYEMLKAQGKVVRLVDYSDAIHGFYVFPEFVQSGQVIEEIKAFIREQRSSEIMYVSFL